MERAELLTLVGIAIAVIMGIPTFAILCQRGEFTTAIVVLIFGFIIIAGLVYYYSDLKRPDFTVIFSRRRLEILDSEGTRARNTLHQKLRANHSGLTEFIYRNISTDGEIKHFRTSIGPPGSSPGRSVNATRQAGDYVVRQKFPHRLRKWRSIETTLTYQLINSYLGNPEGTTLVVSYPIKTASVEIHLPSERPCGSAKVLRLTGSQEQEMGAPNISEDRCTITWEHRNLPWASQYAIEWHW